MIPKAVAVGNWWLAASSQQWAHFCIMSCAEFFFVKPQIILMAQPLYSSVLAPCNFCIFPKLKSLLKGKIFHAIDEIQENIMGQLMVIGRTVWGPKVPTLKELRWHCPTYKVSYILYHLQNVSTFHITWLDTFWKDLVCHLCIAGLLIFEQQ